MVGLCAGLVGLAGCGSPGAPDRHELIDSRDNYDPRSLDPALSTDVPTGRAVGYLFDGLTRFTPDAKVEPALAAALTLPTGWAGVCVIALNLHTLERARRQKTMRVHRIVYSGATAVVATVAAAGSADGARHLFDFLPAGPQSLLAGILAVACYLLVNMVLVYTIIYLVAHPETWRGVFVSHEELVFEISTLVLGVLTAQVVLRSPWLTPGVLLVLALLYRGAMVTQLQVESTIDAKTGLLNFTSWRDLATRSLLRTQRAKQPVAVMLIDLDHFKRINDTYGHLVGDQVLSAVADCVTVNPSAWKWRVSCAMVAAVGPNWAANCCCVRKCW